MGQTKKQLLLGKAARLMGAKQLAGLMRVDDKVLNKWMEGGEQMPNSRLLDLADVLATYASVTKR